LTDYSKKQKEGLYRLNSSLEVEDDGMARGFGVKLGMSITTSNQAG